LLFYVNVVKPDKRSLLFAYRQPVDLCSTCRNDIGVVGDSFVWGQGVGQEEAFCAQLQRQADAQAIGTRIYNLGIVGAGFPEYIQSISAVPAQAKAGRVILCFYPNDMAPVPEASMRLQSFLRGSKKGSLALGVIQDALLKKVMCQDVECYHRLIARSFDKKQPAFNERWKTLLEGMRRFHELALRRSVSEPYFVIFPIMADFNDYPIEQAHKDIAKAAAWAVFIELPVHFRGIFNNK